MLKPTPPDPEALIPQRPARELLGWSEATMIRYRNNPKYRRHNFPKPIEINGRVYFRRTDILAWIALHKARAHAGFAHGRELAQRGRGLEWTPQTAPGPHERGSRSTYTAELQAFCAEILEIKSSLDFAVSSRGWCYILEERIGLGKGDFDQAQALINDCRKSGLLPINICATDSARAALYVEAIDDGTPEDEAADWIATLEEAHNRYTPFSFWEGKEFYLEMWVEKIDLRSLFSPICATFCVPLSNVRGWNDINCRAASMRRFKRWEARRNKCVLLYCGDHDPGGLAISDAIMSNLRDLSGAVGWNPDDLIIDRFGLLRLHPGEQPQLDRQPRNIERRALG